MPRRNRRKKSGNGTNATQHLYCMINLPYFWVWKIGVSADCHKRAEQLTKKYAGKFIPIIWVNIPNAYGIEQLLLAITVPFKVQIKGTGGKELRHLVAGIPLAACILVILAVKYLSLIWGVIMILLLLQ